jgi:hypothetical protein
MPAYYDGVLVFCCSRWQQTVLPVLDVGSFFAQQILVWVGDEIFLSQHFTSLEDLSLSMYA